MIKLNRRQFLKGCCAAGTGTGLGLTRLAVGDANDTNSILIVLFLRGGCDGLNLFPPMNGQDRIEYETGRPDIAVPLTGDNAALDLNGQFGVHPAGAPIKNLYDQGLLAVVRATGNAVAPSRSHFDAMAYMETGTPGSKGTGTGWLTRYFQSLPALPESIVIPSLAATSHTTASFLGDPYVLTMDDPGNFALNTTHWAWNERQQEALTGLYTGDSALETAGAQAITALDIIAGQNFSDYVPGGGAVYPTDYLGTQLQMLAQVIKMGVGIRVAAIDFGGWDTHNGQGDGGGGYFSTNQVGPLANGLAAFMADIGDSGDYQQRVTMLVQTEFGRRFRQNADRGTDHGFGADTMVLGGSVNGGQFFGSWPGLQNAQLFEGMDVAITTDFRRIASEILIRRLENPYLGTIFPGYTDYQPMGIVQGDDIEPVYDDESNMIFSNGFED